MEHDMCGMRINKNIEFCKRCNVAAFLNGSAHNDQFLYSYCKLWLFADRHCNIRQWPKREDTYLIRFCQDSLDQIIHGMVGNRFCARFRQLRISNTACAMHGVRGAQRLDKRKHTPLRDRDMACVRQFQNRKCVTRGFFHSNVSVGSGESFKVYLRRCKREQKSKGIVYTGVSIDNDAHWVHKLTMTLRVLIVE